MAAWSEINKENLRSGFIWDAEHYHPDRLLVEKQLYSKGTDTLNKYVSIISDVVLPYPAYTSYDLTEALGNFLAKEGTVDATSAKKIGLPGDIIISRLRSYLEEVCMLPSRPHHSFYQLSTEFIVLRSKNGEPILWVLPFLLSRQVQTVLKWAQTGSNHPRFRAEELLGLPIKNKIQHIIPTLNNLVRDANVKYEQALNYYPEAEAELLERVGWKTLRKKNAGLSCIVNFNKLAENDRTDAEFFQPQYTYLKKHLKRLCADSLASLVTYCVRGVQPLYVESGSVKVVNSKHLGATQIDFDNLETTTVEFSNRRDVQYAQLRKNDVLVYSTGAYIGRTNIYHSDEVAIASNHVTILGVNKEKCNPAYLALFLNSPAGMAQAAQYATGSAQRELYPCHIKQFMVFVPRNKNGTVDLEWQERLATKVNASTAAKQKARQQLEEAKRLVEEVLKPARE